MARTRDPAPFFDDPLASAFFYKYSSSSPSFFSRTAQFTSTFIPLTSLTQPQRQIIMFSKVASLVTLGLAAFAVAAPGGHGDHYSSSYDCNAGSVQCCGQLHAPTSADGQFLAGLVGVAVGAISGQVGAQCNPISAIGGGTAGNCATTTACCKDYDSANLVGVSCTPLTGQI